MKDLVSDPRPASPSLRKLMNSASGLQIRGKNRHLITLVWVEGGTYFTPLSSTRSWMWWTVDSASPGCFQRENATTAEQLRLQRFSPGFILTLTQDGPQFRTQRLGQASRRYILFPLRMIHSFSIHCDRACDSLLPIFGIFPSASPSYVCISFLPPPPLTPFIPLPITIIIISLSTSLTSGVLFLNQALIYSYNYKSSLNVHVISFQVARLSC